MGHLPAASRMDASSVIRRKVNCGLMGAGVLSLFTYEVSLPWPSALMELLGGGGGGRKRADPVNWKRPGSMALFHWCPGP